MKAAQDMSKMKIPLAKPIVTKEMEEAAVDALWNERFVLGESVYKFEEEFAKFCSVDCGFDSSGRVCARMKSLLARPVL